MNKSLALIGLISTIVIVVTAKPQHHKRQHQESHHHKNHHEAIVSKINNGNNLWKAAINEITEKGEEYVISLLGAKLPKNPSDLDLPLKPKDKIITKYASNPSVIPKSFDARKKWRKCDSVSSIKNQGNCGSCWAVAAASAASDRLCIKTDGNINLNISAENLMSCCEDCVDPGTKGCDGGYSNKAWMYIMNTGIVTGGDYLSEEGCQPYEIPPQSSGKETVTPDCRRICTNQYYDIPFRRDRHFADSVYLYSDNAVIQYDIMTDGPIEAGFIVYDDFPYYKSGVYHRTSTKQLGGHAVRIIGWGNENGEDYWLVANSWGRKWGANGTFKIRRGTNECMFESFCVAGIVSE